MAYLSRKGKRCSGGACLPELIAGLAAEGRLAWVFNHGITATIAPMTIKAAAKMIVPKVIGRGASNQTAKAPPTKTMSASQKGQCGMVFGS